MEIHVHKISKYLAFFQIEVKVEAMGQKVEFGQTKQIKYQFFTLRKSAFMTYGQFSIRNGPKLRFVFLKI